MNEDRSGIERLRTAIDEIAVEIENRGTSVHRMRIRWSMALAISAAVVLIALLIGTWALRPAPELESPEVKVLVLKINGRDVRARIVEDSAPATIIVMPQSESETPPTAASVLIGGAR